MDIRDYIKIADAFGTETKKLAELKEGELADRIANDLGWDQEDAEEIEKSVDDTGNNPAELADIMTDTPPQPVPDADENEPLDSQDNPDIAEPTQDERPDTATPAQPETPTPDEAPQTDAELDADSDDNQTPVDTSDSPQTDAELDADSADNAPQSDSLAGRLDTETPSLLDAYNDGGRQAMDNVRDLQTALSRLGFDPNGIDGKYGRGTYSAVQEFQRQNGLQVDGEAGPGTMAKLQELLNGGEGSATPQADAAAADGTADAADAGTTPPQTNAELDADSADSGTPPAEPAAPTPQTQIDKEARVQSNGTVVIGVNINDQVRQSPYIDYISRDAETGEESTVRVYGSVDRLQRAQQRDARLKRGRIVEPNAAPADQNNSQQAGQPDAERDGRERSVQTASKEFDMKKFIKESKELDECGQMPMPQNEGNPVTMSVTLNASGEENVKDLVRMMQLAGAKDAAPVADMHVGPVDKHDDMVNMMRMMDTPEENVEEEWDNAPEEDYRDHKHMTKDLSGGLNREKKAYAKAQDGDNAMAVESIKSQLLQALEEKGYNK